MKIALIVEGQTEKVFVPILRNFLSSRLDAMPKLDPVTQNGRIPKQEKLQRLVQQLLSNGSKPADHVIALTDVYTGVQPPEFRDAADAKAKMREWVGDESRFHPHAAQYDFEAWLLPYWSAIQRLAGHNATCPSGNPESVNHNRPPAYRIKDIFERGHKRSYSKTRDATAILRGQDLMTAVTQCPELKAFVNTILRLSGATIIE
jgi:hypothetical protein